MGNCLNKASISQRQRGDMMPEEEEEAESLSEMRRISQVLLQEEEEDDVPPTDTEAAAEGLKVKIVLTRGELEWLMAQLKSGDQRLEDVLHHMHAVKAAAVTSTVADKGGNGGWRPRLESILECPETAAT